GVATLDAELDRAAADYGVEITIKGECTGREFYQDAQSGEGSPVTQDRQLGKFLNRTGSELGPDPFVFTSHFIITGMRGPFHAHLSRTVETDRNCPTKLTDRQVQVHSQGGNGRLLYDSSGVCGERAQTLLGCAELSRHVFAL